MDILRKKTASFMALKINKIVHISRNQESLLRFFNKSAQALNTRVLHSQFPAIRKQLLGDS